MPRHLILGLGILLAGCLLATRSAFGLDLLRDSCLPRREGPCISQNNFQGLWVYPPGDSNGHYLDCHYGPTPEPADGGGGLLLPMPSGLLELTVSDRPGSSYCDATGGRISERNGGVFKAVLGSGISAASLPYFRMRFAANFPLRVELVFRAVGDTAFVAPSVVTVGGNEVRGEPPSEAGDWKDVGYDLFSQATRFILEPAVLESFEIRFWSDPQEPLPREAKIWIQQAHLESHPPDKTVLTMAAVEEQVIPFLTGRHRGGEGAEDDDYCYRPEGRHHSQSCVSPEPASRTVAAVVEEIRRVGDGRIGVLDGTGREVGRLPFYEKGSTNVLPREERDQPFTVFLKPSEEMDRIHPGYVPTEGEIAAAVGQGLQVSLAQGETRSASFGVRQNDPRGTRNFQVTMGDLASAGRTIPAGTVVQVRKVRYLFQPDSFGVSLHPQLLEPLEPNEELRGGFTRGFWLTLRAPERPGLYRGRLSLTDGTHVREIPLVLNVLPFALVPTDKFFAVMASLRHLWRYHDPQQPERFTGWALGADGRLAPNNYAARMFQDIQDHGLTAAMALEPIPHRVADDPPRYSLREGDEFFTYDQYRDILRGYREAGFSQNLFAFHTFNLSMADPPAFQAQLQAVRELLGEAGLEGPYMARPWDEPRIGEGRTLGYFQAAARMVREQGMEVITEQTPEFQRAMGTWDDGTPFISMMGGYLGVMTPREVQWQRERGGKACLAVQFSGKRQPLLPERSLRGVWAWRAGLDGYYGWTYHNPIGSSLNPFDRGPTLADEQDAGAVFFDPQRGFLPTLLWEVARDGINDYRYLRTLEDLLGRTSSLPGDLVWRLKARGVLNALRSEIPEDGMEIIHHPPQPDFHERLRSSIVSLIQGRPTRWRIEPRDPKIPPNPRWTPRWFRKPFRF